jgi:hypothetical protein
MTAWNIYDRQLILEIFAVYIDPPAVRVNFLMGADDFELPRTENEWRCAYFRPTKLWQI